MDSYSGVWGFPRGIKNKQQGNYIFAQTEIAPKLASGGDFLGFDPTKKERRTWGKPLGGVLGPDSATKPSKIEVFWLQLGGFSPVAYTENPRPRILFLERGHMLQMKAWNARLKHVA